MKLHKIPNNTRPTTPGTSRQVSKTTPQPRRNMSCCKKKDSLSQSAKCFKKFNNINRYARTLLGVLAASSFATASASASVPALGLASAAYLWPTASASAPTPVPSSGPSCGITLPCESQNVNVYLQSSWTNSREACKPQNWPSVTSAVFSNFNAECPDIVDVHPTNKTQILKSIFNKDNCIADDYCKLFYNNIKLHPEAYAVVMDMNTDLPSSQPTTADPSSQPTTADPSSQPTTALPTTASPTTSNPSYVPTTSKPSYIPTSKPSYEPSSAPSTSAPTRFPTASSAPTLLPFSAPTSARPSHSPTSPPSNKALTEEESNPSRAISGGVLGVVVIGAAIGGLKLGIIIQKMYQNNNFVLRFLRRDQ